MPRKIFIVHAYIVDANGTFNYLSGYPKTFDSKNYGNDPDKAQRRADGDMSETWGAMCKVDTRKIQTVMMVDEFGFRVDGKTTGSFGTPTPEPEVAT